MMVGGGSDILDINDEKSFLGIKKLTAIKDRTHWLLRKMGKNVEKLNQLEEDNAELMKVLSSGRA